MKQIISIIVAIAILSGGTAFAARKVLFTDLPQAVQKAITDQKLGNEKGMKIREDTEDGKTVYKVVLDEQGKDIKLTIASDGTILKNNQSGGDKSGNRRSQRSESNAGQNNSAQTSSGKEGLSSRLGLKKYQVGDLPPAVQNTVRAQAGSEQIANIERESKDGRTVYKVEFKESGRNPAIWVAEDGSLVKENKKAEREGIREKSGAESRGETKASRSDEYRGKSDRNIALTDTPRAVQDAIAKQKGDAKTEGIRIDRKTKDGRVYYEVKFKKDGKNTELHIAEDGSVLPEKD